MTGQELSDRRKLNGVTQAQLAEMLGVSQATLAQWEFDSRRIPDDVANRIKILLPKAR